MLQLIQVEQLLHNYYFWATMKHLPNLLTLGNLFCGCLAIAYILTAQPYVYHSIADGSLRWIMGTEQIYMGSLFIGMPTPAVGILIGSFPMFIWTNNNYVGMLLHSKISMYVFIALICYLMVSKIKFFKMIPSKMALAYSWPQLVIVIGTAAAFPFLKFASVLVAFVLYILLSLVCKYPAEESVN